MCVELPCGYSSQTMAKAVAYADLFLAVTTLLLFGVLWQILCGDWHGLAQAVFTQSFIEHYPRYYQCLFEDGLKFLLIGIGVLYCIGTAILGLILLHAASRRDHKTLRKWYMISAGLIVVRIILCIIIIIAAPSGGRVGPFFLGFFNCFYNVMALSIVQTLTKHIEDEGVKLYSRKNRNF